MITGQSLNFSRFQSSRMYADVPARTRRESAKFNFQYYACASARQALVISHLDYACLVYDSMPGYLKLNVERLMNAGIRYIYNLRRDTHISPYRSELEWLKACDRRK